MTLKDRLSEIEERENDRRSLDSIVQNDDIPKLVKALRVSLEGINKWADYQSGAFAKDTLTEIERILNAEGEG